MLLLQRYKSPEASPRTALPRLGSDLRKGLGASFAFMEKGGRSKPEGGLRLEGEASGG